ncbi:ABC transporter substrate-binding protein [Veronia nyctiphanis]|uniref:ABC transporter substrate-binding protein n=1 Tax=Veronia nyctiphanis TaxID=1278244 RepID=A0A4Q0YYS3_9GAMM|nr:extracellular solute-binding protein [Veronia nyctiphanis]RXJ74369.1 ABC transporter substrate-binding protein [Veronia nyctiphanis]
MLNNIGRRTEFYSVLIGIISFFVSWMLRADPYAPYKGITLNVNFPAHPHYDAVMKIIPDFEKETGIRVQVEQMQYLTMRKMQETELLKPRGRFDLIAFVVFSKADYVFNDQIEPLARFFMTPSLADPYYEPSDIINSYVQNIGVAGGHKGYLPGPTDALYGLPFGAETSILAYRKDLFIKHGLRPPENYSELLNLACKIPELEPGIVGLSSRGQPGHHLSHAFLLHLAPLGGRVFDRYWNPTVNSPQAIRAVKTLKKILDCSPTDMNSYGLREAKNQFLFGRSAMYLDSTVIAGEITDPEKSNVMGKVGWIKHPRGVRYASQTGGFGLAIPKNAKHKDAAFLLMQWLTSKETDKKIALAGGNPIRFSTHLNPDVLKKLPYLETFGKALNDADPDWRPIIPPWSKINILLGGYLSLAMEEGADIQKLLNAANQEIRGIMKEAGYFTYKGKH